MISVTPVVLCGGSGTRLWPLSRAGFPKQFLCLTGNESLFQQAARRVTDIASSSIQVNPLIVVTGEEHRFLASEQLREVNIEMECALLEPVGKNTAPALTLAALAALKNGRDPVLAVIPADQTMTNSAAFTSAVQAAVFEASKGKILILGIKPDRPETGYGYINVEDAISSSPSLTVSSFVEKPDELTAKNFFSKGGYFWNAGMFMLKASIWLKALEQFRPDIAEATRLSWEKKSIDEQFVRPDRAEFAAIPDESIDYAVMEHCPGSIYPIEMIPLDAGWSDLGAWDAVWNILPKDERGNAHIGDAVAAECSNTLVHSTSRLVTLVGMQDVIVIETPDAVLVANKSCSQDVKKIVNELGKQKREEHALHRKVNRPWGWYDCIDEGSRFKVKRILVNPKARLSLQKHHHRAEHWIVVKGTAEITKGETVEVLTENQSTYIPLGEIHQLSNPGSIPLEIIEVQSGSYLGEDDIIRISDQYGRVK